MAPDLYTAGRTAGDLHRFIANHVQPDAAFLDTCNGVINRLVHFLQNNVPGRLRPRRVIKSGSLGKGTAVRGKSDVDLILMLSCYNNVESLLRDIGSILQELKTYLVRFGEVELERVTKFSVQVKVKGRGIDQSVDILPAVDLLDQGVLPVAVYEQMNRPGADIHEYSVTLGPLQVEIISALPTKVKDLIRLVKYWEDEKMKSVKNRKWPSSYTMELVVLNSWNEAGRPQNFDFVRALHAVLSALVNHRNFRVVFDKQMKYPRSLLQTRQPPYIMDPTNPYNDMYHGLFGNAWDWEDVAEEANVWLRKPIFQNVKDTRQRW